MTITKNEPRLMKNAGRLNLKHEPQLSEFIEDALQFIYILYPERLRDFANLGLEMDLNFGARSKMPHQRRQPATVLLHGGRLDDDAAARADSFLSARSLAMPSSVRLVPCFMGRTLVGSMFCRQVGLHEVFQDADDKIAESRLRGRVDVGEIVVVLFCLRRHLRLFQQNNVRILGGLAAQECKHTGSEGWINHPAKNGIQLSTADNQDCVPFAASGRENAKGFLLKYRVWPKVIRHDGSPGSGGQIRNQGLIPLLLAQIHNAGAQNSVEKRIPEAEQRQGISQKTVGK